MKIELCCGPYDGCVYEIPEDRLLEENTPPDEWRTLSRCSKEKFEVVYSLRNKPKDSNSCVKYDFFGYQKVKSGAF